MHKLKLRFENLRKQLTETCFQGQYHYRTYKRLRTLLYEKDSPRNLAPLFFDMCIPAHFYTSIGYLCQLYDYHDQSISIYKYLSFIKSNIHLLKLVKITPIIDAIKKDENDIKENKRIIDNLMILRSRYYFHLDKRYIDEPLKVFQDHPITYNEIEKLYKEAGELINRYSVYYDDSETFMGISNEEDIFNLFNYLDKSLKRDKEDFNKKYRMDHN